LRPGIIVSSGTARALDAELLYRHLIQPNAFVGSSFVVDEVTLRGMFPFPERTHLAFATAASYQHARALDGNGQLTSALDLVVVDGTLAWAPLRELSLFARYQFFDQLSAPALSAAPSFTRHEVMLGLSGIYPGQAALALPSRARRRVDPAERSATQSQDNPQ
jgi:hypothetical protein